MQFSVLTSLIPAPIPTVFHPGFSQAGAVFLGQEVLVSRSRWEQCEGSGNSRQCSWFRLRGHLPWGGGKASAGAQDSSQNPSFQLLVLVSWSCGLSFG